MLTKSDAIKANGEREGETSTYATWIYVWHVTHTINTQQCHYSRSRAQVFFIIFYIMKPIGWQSNRHPSIWKI